MEVFNHRREHYLLIMENLFKLQKTYSQAQNYLNIRVDQFIPKTEDEIEEWDLIADQIEACKSAIDKLESIKNCFSLGFLSEGGLITVEDLFKAVVLLEKFLEAVEEEKAALLSNEDYYLNFLNSKEAQLSNVKVILETLLEYKLERRHDFNQLEKH